MDPREGESLEVVFRRADTDLEATCAELTSRAPPVLQFIYSLSESWDTALYLLKHLARALFGLRYNEHVWAISPGQSGKDTFLNLAAALLGTYFVDVEFELLTSSKMLMQQVLH